jgi:hypothetical protein
LAPTNAGELHTACPHHRRATAHTISVARSR